MFENELELIIPLIKTTNEYKKLNIKVYFLNYLYK